LLRVREPHEGEEENGAEEIQSEQESQRTSGRVRGSVAFSGTYLF